jgi:hypothetical protein
MNENIDRFVLNDRRLKRISSRSPAIVFAGIIAAVAYD